jgi:hypothetical protein
MEILFALAAVFFVIFSFFGLLKVLFRWIAVLCIVAAITLNFKESPLK